MGEDLEEPLLQINTARASVMRRPTRSVRKEARHRATGIERFRATFHPCLLPEPIRPDDLEEDQTDFNPLLERI